MPENYKVSIEYGWTCTECNRVWAKEIEDCPCCGAERVFCELCEMFFCEHDTHKNVTFFGTNGAKADVYDAVCEGCMQKLLNIFCAYVPEKSRSEEDIE